MQICLGVPAPPVTDENRYAALLLNTVLGGGMSSRLFQTIREERGMVYSIYSDLSPYRDTGTLCVYAGTSVGKALEVVDLILAEFRNLKQDPIPEEELIRAKDQLKGNILMGLENSTSRMANLARQEVYFHQFFLEDEIIACIDQVTTASVQAMAQLLFDPMRIAVTLLGRLDGVKLSRPRLLASPNLKGNVRILPGFAQPRFTRTVHSARPALLVHRFAPYRAPHCPCPSVRCSILADGRNARPASRGREIP